MIKVKIDVLTAAAVRQSLFNDTKGYTYDTSCIPKRVSDIRSVILDIDSQIEAELEKTSASNSVENS